MIATAATAALYIIAAVGLLIIIADWNSQR